MGLCLRAMDRSGRRKAGKNRGRRMRAKARLRVGAGVIIGVVGVLLTGYSIRGAEAVTNAEAKRAYNVRAGTLTNIVVAADGSGQFKTVQEGIQAAATGTPSQPVVV